MDFKKTVADVLEKVELCSGSLIWADNATAPGLVGTPVTEMGVFKEVGDLTEEEAKLVLPSVRKSALARLKETEKAKAKEARAKPDADRRKDARAEEEAIAGKVLSYLKPRLRLHNRDKVNATYIYLEGKLELFQVGWEPIRTLHLNDFIGYLSQKDGEEWGKMQQEVQEDLKNKAGVFEEAGRVIPEFSDILLKVLTRILAMTYEETIIAGDLPIIAWGKKALQTFDPELLKPGEYQHFQKYVDRVCHGREFMAFMWKLFDPEDMGRQIVWSHSAGHSGQSTFWNVVTEFMDKVKVSLQKASNQDKHTAAECYLKRLAIVTDCGNKHFYSTELVRQLSGNDQASVRQLYKNAITAKLFCKVVACSNISPEIDTTSNAMRTRLLYFRVRKFDSKIADPQIDAKYRAEFWHFLFACREVHNEICEKLPEGGYGPIPMQDSMWENIQAYCETQIRTSVRSFVGERVRLDPHGEVKVSELYLAFKGYYSSSTNLGPEAARDISTQRTEIYQAFDNLLIDIPDWNGKVKSGARGMKIYQGIRLLGDSEIGQTQGEELDI